MYRFKARQGEKKRHFSYLDHFVYPGARKVVMTKGVRMIEVLLSLAAGPSPHVVATTHRTAKPHSPGTRVLGRVALLCGTWRLQFAKRV